MAISSFLYRFWFNGGSCRPTHVPLLDSSLASTLSLLVASSPLPSIIHQLPKKVKKIITNSLRLGAGSAALTIGQRAGSSVAATAADVPALGARPLGHPLVLARSHVLLCPFLLVAPGNVFARETRFSRDKHLGTEGVGSRKARAESKEGRVAWSPRGWSAAPLPSPEPMPCHTPAPCDCFYLP
jgi:hypothetical protein